MIALAFLLIAAGLALPITWLASEFYLRTWLRVILGVLALLAVIAGTALVVTVGTRFNYNAWYGGATGELIHTSVHQIEEGNLERVLTVWRGLDRQYRPTYESRANYDELMREAIQLISGEKAIDLESPWNASAFAPGRGWDIGRMTPVSGL